MLTSPNANKKTNCVTLALGLQTVTTLQQTTFPSECLLPFICHSGNQNHDSVSRQSIYSLSRCQLILVQIIYKIFLPISSQPKFCCYSFLILFTPGSNLLPSHYILKACIDAGKQCLTTA